MYTNADSLLNKMDELRRDIQAKDPYIIAITEIKPKKFRFPITKAEINIQGYETHTNDLGTKKGREILIYVKNNLESNEIVFKTEFQESLWITIKMNRNDKPLFGCIYRSESLPEKNNDALCALLREACIVGNNNKKFDQCIIVNPKLAWKYIKSKYNVKEGIPELIKEPNAVILELTKSDKEKADTLQSNFCSVFTKEPQGPLPDIENKHIEHKMHKIRIHEDEIGKLLSQLKINKSCGPDGLHPYFLKTLHQELKTPLNIIFNNTLETGELPDRWKEANISAIYNKREKRSSTELQTSKPN